MNKSKVVKLMGVVLILILFIAACSSNNSVVNNNDTSDVNNSDIDNSENVVVDNDANVEDSEDTEETEGEETDEIQILGFAEARDFLVQYFFSQYGIEQVGPWMEQDLTPEGLVGSSTIRFVSGPLTIKMSAPVVAPENLVYTIEEASYIVNGFYWEGTVNYFGEITETTVIPPAPILSDELARDAVLEYLSGIHSFPEFGEWADEGYSQSGDDTTLITFTSAPWIVVVEFEPSAPLVSSYHVTVESSADGFFWEGDITLHGLISSSADVFNNDVYGYSFEVPAACYVGPLQGDCKLLPPAERSEECLCFINGRDPDSVMMQKFTITADEVILATFMVVSFDTPAYSPPEGADLVAFVQQEFGSLYSVEIPDETNMDLGGVPALRIEIPGSPGVGAYDEIFFIRNNDLFRITLIDTNYVSNMYIYEQILESFEFSE